MCNIPSGLLCCHCKELEACRWLRYKLKKIQDAERPVICDPAREYIPVFFLPFKNNLKHVLFA